MRARSPASVREILVVRRTYAYASTATGNTTHLALSEGHIYFLLPICVELGRKKGSRDLSTVERESCTIVWRRLFTPVVLARERVKAFPLVEIDSLSLSIQRV